MIGCWELHMPPHPPCMRSSHARHARHARHGMHGTACMVCISLQGGKYLGAANHSISKSQHQHVYLHIQKAMYVCLPLPYLTLYARWMRVEEVAALESVWNCRSVHGKFIRWRNYQHRFTSLCFNMMIRDLLRSIRTCNNRTFFLL